MIQNLFIQEFQDTRKGLTALFGIYLVLQVGSWAAIAAGIPVLSGFFIALSALLIVMAPVGVLIFLAWNYWQTMYGTRGYFTFSIPVAGRTLYAVKVAYAALISTVALLLSGASIPALVAMLAVGKRQPVGELFTSITDMIPPGLPGWVMPTVIALVFIQTYLTIIIGSAIMSIGAQGRYNSLGFGAPVIGVIIFYVANQIISLIATMVIPLGIGLSGPNAGKLVAKSMGADFIAAIQTGAEPTVLGLGSYIAALLIAAAMWWWAVKAIEEHTSLR